MSMETQDILVPELSGVSQLIDNQPELLATGSKDLQNAALKATKFIFDLSVQSEGDAKDRLDELFSQLAPTQAPQTRSQTRKRKRSPSPPVPKVKFETTPLSNLFVDGMAEDQIWSQLELRAKNICGILDFILEHGPVDEEGLDGLGDDEDSEDDEEGEEIDEKLAEALERVRRGEDVDFEKLGLDDSLAELLQSQAAGYDDEEVDNDDGDDDDDEDEFDEDEDEGDGEEEDEGIALNDSPSDEEDDEEEPVTLMDIISRSQKRSKPKSAVHDELDDGFFDLDVFNAETEQAEAKKASSGRLDEDEESSDEEGSVDLFAPVDNLEAFEEDDLENDASNLYYKDFFKAPPKSKKSYRKSSESPKKAGSVRFHEEVRVKKIRPKGKNRPTAEMYIDDNDDEDEDVDVDEFGELNGFGSQGGGSDEEGMDDDDAEVWGGINGNDDDSDDDKGDDDGGDNPRDTIERLKDDLFAEDELETQSDMTTHEKRMAALKEQIAELEQENVAQKEWMLMGEADSRARPQNSLLEEDLEFERVQKPVPVITEEVVQGLEERIKARIREGRFDDVVRVRPLEDKPFLPSRLFELNDSKSKQSLAQIYEDEYVAAQTGGVAGEDRDRKLRKEHEEIEKLWEGICSKLDALCNAYYTPKQPKATISTISNVPTASLESALPTTKSASTMLAPEEVFTPAASDLRAKSEMTPAEKQALRRKERKARKKRRDALETSVDKYAKSKKVGSVKKQKEEALKSVVKSGKGVTVVGKKSKDILGKGKKGKS
uniref:U3 small nucleolar ribonucleoprotein protein MPP10 n=1 Tax=Moniliophthora roreri TaxID=221103 RepID=A0A0W0EXV0_MONRR